MLNVQDQGRVVGILKCEDMVDIRSSSSMLKVGLTMSLMRFPVMSASLPSVGQLAPAGSTPSSSAFGGLLVFSLLLQEHGINASCPNQWYRKRAELTSYHKYPPLPLLETPRQNQAARVASARVSQ
jgi:hypothetical protein